MKARWVGVLTVGASVLLGATAVRADERTASDRKELSGKVVKSDASTLYLEHMGAVVPIEIGQGTSFSGVQGSDQLAEGQEVRASFTVKDDTKNVADSVSVGAPSGRRSPEPAPEEYQDYGG